MKTPFLLSMLVLLAGCNSAPELRGTHGKGEMARSIAGRITPDFRFFFEPEEEIERLAANHLCRIEYFGNTAEIPVREGLLLHEVVLSFLKDEYDGQIKVISRDRISQTPVETYDPGQQMHITVNPGDLVFIQGRQ